MGGRYSSEHPVLCTAAAPPKVLMKGKKKENGCKKQPQQSSLTPETGARSAGLIRLVWVGWWLLVSRRHCPTLETACLVKCAGYAGFSHSCDSDERVLYPSVLLRRLKPTPPR